MPWKSKAENGHPNHSGYLLKSATPVVRTLGNGIESTTTTSQSKTSLSPGICQSEKDKILNLPQASAAATIVVANPLLDSGDSFQYHPSHRLTPSMLHEKSRNGLMLTDIRRCAKGIEKNNQNDFSWLCQGV
jgi:hypothetical protein